MGCPTSLQYFWHPCASTNRCRRVKKGYVHLCEKGAHYPKNFKPKKVQKIALSGMTVTLSGMMVCQTRHPNARFWNCHEVGAQDRRWSTYHSPHIPNHSDSKLTVVPEPQVRKTGWTKHMSTHTHVKNNVGMRGLWYHFAVGAQLSVRDNTFTHT